MPGGFPHSEISGSKVKGTSPKRIAAFRVFHRYVEPRHPPYALTFLLGNLEIISIYLFSPSTMYCPTARTHDGLCLSHLQRSTDYLDIVSSLFLLRTCAKEDRVWFSKNVSYDFHKKSRVSGGARVRNGCAVRFACLFFCYS